MNGAALLLLLAALPAPLPASAQAQDVPAIAPTLINPRLPGRNATQDTGATQRENRFLQTPAPGLRLTTPMAW